MPIVKNHCNSGMSLVEVMIGLGIMSIVIFLGYRVLNNTQQMTFFSEDRLNLRSVARTIENQTDCSNVPKVCGAGTLVAIPKKNGGTLIAATGQTMLSSWRLRALCTGNNRFKVQASRVNAKGNFVKDPVTQKLLDWDHPNATIFAEKALCSSRPEAPVASSQDLLEVKPGASCLVGALNQLPCTPPLPPACGAGMISKGLSMDTFGGKDDSEVPNVFGQRWIRYCSPAGAGGS